MISRSFANALRDPLVEDDPYLSVIAEVKKASPSVGVIANEFDPVAIASEYDRCGANAISVLTDEKFFQGRLSYLLEIRDKVSVPVLRKDFIVHEAQIYESVIAGADAILLIVAVLTQGELIRFLEIAHTYQLDVLVEVHDLTELDRAMETDARIIRHQQPQPQNFRSVTEHHSRTRWRTWPGSYTGKRKRPVVGCRCTIGPAMGSRTPSSSARPSCVVMTRLPPLRN